MTSPRVGALGPCAVARRRAGPGRRLQGRGRGIDRRRRRERVRRGRSTSAGGRRAAEGTPAARAVAATGRSPSRGASCWARSGACAARRPRLSRPRRRARGRRRDAGRDRRRRRAGRRARGVRAGDGRLAGDGHDAVRADGPDATVAGGQDFRDNIYAWPTFGRCAIEEAISSRSLRVGDDFARLLVNRRGLARARVPPLLSKAPTPRAPAASRRAGRAVRRRARGAQARLRGRRGPRRARRAPWPSTAAWDPARRQLRRRRMRTARARQRGLPDRAGGDRTRRARDLLPRDRRSRTEAGHAEHRHAARHARAARVPLRRALDGEHPRQPRRSPPRARGVRRRPRRARLRRSAGRRSAPAPWPTRCARRRSRRRRRVDADRGADHRPGAGPGTSGGRRAPRRDRRAHRSPSRPASTRRWTSSRRGSRPTTTPNRCRSGQPSFARAAGRGRPLSPRPATSPALAAFRVAFGLIVCVSALRFLAYGWIDELFVAPTFHFNYWGFGWVPAPPPGADAGAVRRAGGRWALLVALGLCLPRRRSWLLFVRLHVPAARRRHDLPQPLLPGQPARAACSAFSRRTAPGRSTPGCGPALRAADRCPPGAPTLLRFQVGVVYVFAGLAKATADWLLHAQPLASGCGADRACRWSGRCARPAGGRVRRGVGGLPVRHHDRLVPALRAGRGRSPTLAVIGVPRW